MKFKNLLLAVLFFLLAKSIYSSQIQSNINPNDFVDNPRIVLIDVGQTLIEIYKSQLLFKSLDFKDLMVNTFRFIFQGNFNISKAMTNRYLTLLNKIPSGYPDPDYKIIGYNGIEMPALQRDSQRGIISLETCRKIISQWIYKNPHEFKNKTEKRIFEKLCKFNFDAETFVSHQRFTKIMHLLRKLYLQVDPQTKKRTNLCFIFSNQPREVVEQLKIKFPEIFEYSDLQIFSCFEGDIKTHPKIIKKYLSICPNKNQTNVYLIDDEIDNLKAAEKIKYKNFKIIGVHPSKVNKQFLKKLNL